MIMIVIVGVLALSAILGWGAWRFLKSAEDARRVRRRLILLGMLYVFAVVNGIVEVAKGRAPLQALIGLPIGLAFAWWYLRSASSIQLPPK